MENAEVEKSRLFVTVEMLEYIPHSAVIKAIIKKSTGHISVVAMDSGEILEKISPFDNFIQITEGKAEIVIDDVSNLLESGESIIIPAYSRHKINANSRCKMTSTVIKSGY
jgi:quercetin dioxygenase-like cupin family protein